MKSGWILVNGFLYTGKFAELTRMFAEAAKREGIQLKVMTNAEVCTGIFEREKTLKKPDFVLFWDKDTILANYLELSGIPVFNSSHAIACCDDKRKTYLALLKAGLPIPQTVAAPMTYPNIGFPSVNFLESIERELGFPMIVKEAFGSFGEQVYQAKNHRELEHLVEKLQKTPFLFQKYIETSYGQDIRIQVVGNRAVAAMRRFSESNFRANITAGGSMEALDADPAACELAVRACQATGCDFAGVDLLFAEHGFVICEVNSNAHFKNLYDCTGVNAAEAIMRYIVSSPRLESAGK